MSRLSKISGVVIVLMLVTIALIYVPDRFMNRAMKDPAYVVGVIERKLSATDQLTSVAFRDSRTLFATTFRSGLKSISMGSTTELASVNAPSDWRLNAIWFFGQDSGVAVGASGTVLRTEDGGRIWHLQPSFTDANLTKVSFKESVGFVSGERIDIDANTGVTRRRFEIWKSVDRGASWRQVYSAEDSSTVVFEISVCSKQNVFAVTGNQRMLSSDDDGETWREVRLDIRVLSSTCSERQTWVVDDTGRLMSSIGGLRDWTPVALSNDISDERWKAVRVDADGRGLLVSDRTVAITTDFGRSWKRSMDTPVGSIESLVVGAGMGAIIGSEKIAVIGYGS
jgi:photosystem II stability/assembly factor-like uncharacterized protein